MLRRLFFLFPNEIKAQRAVNQLLHLKIPLRHIHAISPDRKLTTLPEATDRQKNDTTFKVERFFWHTNLLIFFMALLVLVASAIALNGLWVVISLGMMIATFVVAEEFVVKIPDVHLTEFTDALSHGEVLLMVDVPRHIVAEIENYIHHRHPEAVIGGVGWTMDAFEM
jgi:hypothetical protein